MTGRARRLVIIASLLPVITESVYLGYVLLNTKPFKLMSDPSQTVYLMIAIVGAISASGAAVAVAMFTRSSRVAAAPIIAVSVAALIFLIVFWAFTAIDRGKADRSQPASQPAASDGLQGIVKTRSERVADARKEYALKVAGATVLGLLLAVISGFALRPLARRMQADQSGKVSDYASVH